MARIRLVVVDDHALVHEAVETVLSTQPDIEIVAHGYSGEDAVRLCATYSPDVLLTDVMRPEMDGQSAIKIIHEQHPSIRIIVLTSFEDDNIIHEMLRNGASGYILKDALLADLVSTVRAVHLGNSVFSPLVTSKLLQAYTAVVEQPNFKLTQREREVIRLMAEGLSLNEIAGTLVISTSTVKFHMSNALQKMNVNTRAEAIVLAAKNNLI